MFEIQVTKLRPPTDIYFSICVLKSIPAGNQGNQHEGALSKNPARAAYFFFAKFAICSALVLEVRFGSF